MATLDKSPIETTVNGRNPSHGLKNCTQLVKKGKCQEWRTFLLVKKQQTLSDNKWWRFADDHPSCHGCKLIAKSQDPMHDLRKNLWREALVLPKREVSPMHNADLDAGNPVPTRMSVVAWEFRCRGRPINKMHKTGQDCCLLLWWGWCNQWRCLPRSGQYGFDLESSSNFLLY